MMMKTMVIALSLAAALLVVVAVSIAAPARAQGGLAAPGNVRVADGANPGTVTVSWDAADDAAFYRIGWVAKSDYDAVIAAGQSWLDAFAFTDVDNRGQSEHNREQPGAGRGICLHNGRRPQPLRECRLVGMGSPDYCRGFGGVLPH